MYNFDIVVEKRTADPYKFMYVCMCEAAVAAGH